MHKLKKILYVLMITIAMIFIYTNIAKATTVEITTETLYLRAEATTESDIVDLISIGEECELLGEEGDWYQVKYGEHTGYISKEYAKVVGGDSGDSNTSDTNNSNEENNADNNSNNGNEDNQTDNNSGSQESQTNSNDTNSDSNTNNSNSETSAEGQTTTDNQTAENTDSNTQSSEPVTATTKQEVDVRIVPLINGSVVEKLKNNTEVTVINQINGWAYIQTDTISGWVRTDTLNIQETSSNNGNSSDSNDNSSDNADTSDNQDSSDTNTSDNNTSDFEARTMYTNDSGINIRKEASTDSEILMVVDVNTSLKVIGESGDWYQVETSQGNAYVSKDLLSNERTSVTNRGDIDRESKENDDNTKEESKSSSSTKSSSKPSSTSSSNSTTSSSSASNSSSSSTSSSSSDKGQEIVAYAKKFLGVPYVYGGASPSGFDCSGFTMYVYDHFGISMAHGAQAQSKLGTAINVDKSSKSSMLNNLEVGDLVFFLDYETMDEIGHCGIYIGDGNFIHASSGSGYCVKINSLLPGEYYNTRYCAARRVL